MSTVVLFGRPNCPLCDEARATLLGAEIAFDEVDVAAEVELEEEYGIYVPVVEVSGQIVFHAGMDPSTLAEAVTEASTRADP